MTLKELLNREKIALDKREKEKKKGKQNDILTVYFGVPGSGKTTMAAWLTKQAIKQNRDVYSNVPITGAYQLDPKTDLGFYEIFDAAVIIDEASVEYNNRKFKEMPQETIEWLKYHRHAKCAVYVFSQSQDDMDITIRRLAQRLYLMEKTILPWFVKRKHIGKKIGIDEKTKQIIDEYFFVPFGTRYIFSPTLWKMFNTLSRKKLPDKVWEKW